MIHIYIILAVLLTTFIEWQRIKAVKGRWLNVPKWVSWLIAAGLNAVIFWIHGLDKWYYLIPEMMFMRGLLYDPVLNALTDKKLDNVSTTTNSWVDRFERWVGLHFWPQRILYGILALSYALLYIFN